MGKNQITHVKQVASAGEGRHKIADTKGLYLIVKDSGTRSFGFSMMHRGVRHERGLGSYPAVGLREAKDKAVLMAIDIRGGATARRGTRAVTFKEAAEATIDARAKNWTSAIHLKQWRSTLETYAYPKIGTKLVSDISRSDLVAVLKPIWTTKYETARSVLNRIALVLDTAIALEMCEVNVARNRKALEVLLGEGGSAVMHHAALPHAKVEEFMVELRQLDSLSAAALEFTVLTACRTSEVINAKWDEIDLDAALWVIPPERMKGKKGKRKEHRVPLSPQAVAILERVRKLPSPAGWVFPTKFSCLSNMGMLMCLKGFRPDLTVHGFRSTFRDWAADCTDYPHEVVEAALAHSVSSEVVAAYRRTTFFDKRAALMIEWADHCDGIETAPAADAPATTESLLAQLKASGVSTEEILKALLAEK